VLYSGTGEITMVWSAVMGTGLEQAGRMMIGVTGAWHRPVHDAEPIVAVGGDGEGIRGGRGPVVVLGGLGETDPCLKPMVRWLERLGYDVTGYTLRAGMGCSQRTVDSLERRIRILADGAGEPVRIVGHSRGGQFGRAVGVQAPDVVGQLVTLGTPFDLWGGLTPPMTAMAWGLAAAGSAGVPGLLGLACLVGGCCRDFRASLRAAWPDDVPFTSIYSRSDGAVPWRSAHDPYADNVVVRGGHVSLLCSAAAQRAVADALARVGRQAGPGIATPGVAVA